MNIFYLCIKSLFLHIVRTLGARIIYSMRVTCSIFNSFFMVFARKGPGSLHKTALPLNFLGRGYVRMGLVIQSIFPKKNIQAFGGA